MSPRQFEDAIAELFKRLGYKVRQTPYSSDGGKDAVAWKDNKKVLIECKRFAINRSVGRRDIQILHSAIVDAKAEEGFYVTTGATYIDQVCTRQQDKDLRPQCNTVVSDASLRTVSRLFQSRSNVLRMWSDCLSPCQ